MSRPGARHGDEPRNTYTAADAMKWQGDWRAGKTLKRIAQENGVSISTITRWLSKHARGELS